MNGFIVFLTVHNRKHGRQSLFSIFGFICTLLNSSYHEYSVYFISNRIVAI